jgi:ankyrin repeat protein
MKNTQLNLQEALKKYGFNSGSVGASDRAGMSIIHEAVAAGDKEVVKVILDEFRDLVDIPGGYGYATPIFFALRDSEMVKLLLEYGARTDTQERSSYTPLHMAVWEREATVAQLLLQYGADANFKDSNNDTPLHFAAMDSRIEAVKLLLQYGADVAVKNDHGETPLHRAFDRYTDIQVVEILLKKGADVNVPNKNGLTPFQLGACQPDGHFVELMLDHGADIKLLDTEINYISVQAEIIKKVAANLKSDEMQPLSAVLSQEEINKHKDLIVSALKGQINSSNDAKYIDYAIENIKAIDAGINIVEIVKDLSAQNSDSANVLTLEENKISLAFKDVSPFNEPQVVENSSEPEHVKQGFAGDNQVQADHI